MTKIRSEASGLHWRERFVDREHASTSSSVEEAITNCWSIVLVDEFASLDECEAVLQSALSRKDEHQHIMGASFVNVNCNRHPMATLDASANDVNQVWFQRLLEFLELHLYGIFNQSELAQKNYVWYSEPDDQGVLQSEPKVNLYTKGGQFAKHVDGMRLTLLVMLNDDYEAPGTAFFKESDEDKPSLVVRPKSVGSAMIWGGNLLHSALPTTSGLRAVYVGSFDMATEETESEEDE